MCNYIYCVYELYVVYIQYTMYINIIYNVYINSDKLKRDSKQQQQQPILSESELPPTPLYNLAILEDMAILTQHSILSKTILPLPKLQGALILFKV